MFNPAPPRSWKRNDVVRFHSKFAAVFAGLIALALFPQLNARAIGVMFATAFFVYHVLRALTEEE